MIYTLGDNSLGQLGLGENHITKENKEGVLLKDLLNYRINDICVGKNHSFCFGVVRELTKAGNEGPNNNAEFDPKRPYYLFGWGDNSYNQLGMKQNNTMNIILRPTKICCNNNLHNPAIIGEELINICCGHNFSALLFKSGKLLTFGDNQYNQLIHKENEIMPNLTNNYLPKNIGKIIKIITGGNSLMLMTEFNKLIIFGKYNEPNLDNITMINLVNNCENNKYIFNDNILKFVIFNNEVPNPEVIKNILNIKINEFLVNVINKEIQKKNESPSVNVNKTDKINSKPNDINNNINKNNEVNNNTNNNFIKNKNITDRNVNNPNNKALETQSSKKHLKLNSSLIHASKKGNTFNESKKQLSKNLNTKKNIKYKNSFSKISKISSDKKILTDTLGIFQSGNTKIKTENKTEFNGAEKKSENLNIMKAYESNGKSSQIKNDNNNKVFNLEKDDFKINNSQKEKEIVNKVNQTNENENGNSEQKIIFNQLKLNDKPFLNKNILKGKVPLIQNRYEETYDSQTFSIDNKQTEKKIEDKKENNGGNIKNIEEKEKLIKKYEFENIYSNTENEINVKNEPNEQLIGNIISKNINNKSNEFEIQFNNNKIGNLEINNNINKNIDNNISNNNSLNKLNNFLNKDNKNQETKQLLNLDNNSKTFMAPNKTKDIKAKDNEIIKTDNNNNFINGINSKNNINSQKKTEIEISFKQKENNNLMIPKNPENKNISIINQKDTSKVISKKESFNSNIKNNKIPEKKNTNPGYLPIKINSAEKNENSNNENKNQVKPQEKKENTSIFRELGQFVTSTMNRINKYTKNRIDNKKDSFFENIISGNFSSNLRNINSKSLLNNIISGVPNRYRGRFWLKCIGNQLSITPDYFNINLSKYYEKYEDTKESKYILPFPNLGIFKENTPLTLDLCEVINGFVISRPDIKYNENISYLVGMLIINMDKYQAYVSFMNLILNPNILIYYLSGNKEENIMEYGYSDTPTGEEGSNINKNKKIPSIVEKNLRRVIFKQLLFHNLPDLCSNLELINVLPEDYFDEWNQTIFCKNFNIDLSMKIWDLFVVQGEKIIFDAGIAIMKELEEELNNCEEKEEALNILLNSQMREINEVNVMKYIQKVEYPEWIQTEVIGMSEDTIIPVVFNKT